MPVSLPEIRSHLRSAKLDAWLLTDFRGSNAPARRILGAPACSRRWWYLIRADDVALKLEPAVESGVLRDLPGEAIAVSQYEHATEALRPLLRGRTVAMEYSPGGVNPYVSHVDAGTVERVRALGATVVSSQDLLQHFDARWTGEQWQSHQAASRALLGSFDAAVREAADGIARGMPLTEYEITARCMQRLRSQGMLVEHLNTSVNEHTALPHYDPSPQGSSPIRAGDLLLMDHFCRVDRAGGPSTAYADYTRVYYFGKTPPGEYARAFDAVVRAREAALAEVETACKAGRAIKGKDLDLIARRVLIEAGYEGQIAHRTGHNLGTTHVHGNGAHLDAVEHPDDRTLIPETAFTIEPGVYFAGKFGVRTEINVYIDERYRPHVTGERPERIEIVSNS
jgi:Xaa-Pro aminopeptidase